MVGDMVQSSAMTIEEILRRVPGPTEVIGLTYEPEGLSFLESALAAERGAVMAVPPAWRDPLAAADVLVTHFFPVRREVLDLAPNLRVLATLRHGMENLDLDEAQARGILVINNPGREAEAVSDLTVGLILDALRGISRAARILRAGGWLEPSDSMANSRNVKSTTIGVVGFGYVGQLTAKKLAAFGGRVVVADPFVAPDVIETAGFDAVTMEDLLQTADVVTLHVRLGSATKALIGKPEIDSMRDRAILVNTSRADLVDEAALMAALQEGRLGWAALDVFWDEPLGEAHPLRQLERVTLTPHMAGSTADSSRISAALLAHRLAEALGGMGPSGM